LDDRLIDWLIDSDSRFDRLRYWCCFSMIHSISRLITDCWFIQGRVTYGTWHHNTHEQFCKESSRVSGCFFLAKWRHCVALWNTVSHFGILKSTTTRHVMSPLCLLIDHVIDAYEYDVILRLFGQSRVPYVIFNCLLIIN